LLRQQGWRGRMNATIREGEPARNNKGRGAGTQQ
jgi:hypothetical protein